MVVLLENYAKRFKRLQKFITQGWNLYDVDLVEGCYYFDKIDVISGIKRILRVAMTEEEKLFFRALNDAYAEDGFLRKLVFALIEKMFEDLFINP